MPPVPRDIKAHRDAHQLEIVWESGACRHSFHAVRCACSCAICVDEITGARLLDPATVPADISIEQMQLVGAYALRITWSDGHATGLYTWEQLRGLPPE